MEQIKLPLFRAGAIIYGILSSNVDITNIAGKNIMPLVAPKSTDGNILLYRRESYKTERTNMGVYTEKCEVSVTAVCDDYDSSIDLALLVLSVMEGNKVYDIRLIDSEEEFEEGKYFQVLVFSIE